jgi:hypothetical protein
MTRPVAAAVQDMRWCPWCRSTLPADHVCPAGSVGCTQRAAEDTPCGVCAGCIAAMTADLARYGSPSDLHTP